MGNLTIIESEKIEAIQSELQEIKLLILKKNNEESLNKWISPPEAKARLKVCKKTLDNYLKNGIIPYSRFAGKIYIKLADIEAHLQRNYISA